MPQDLPPEDIVYRLRKRAEIRRQISTRKSVQEGKPDRIADLLEEAAAEIERLTAALAKGDRRSLMSELIEGLDALRQARCKSCEGTGWRDSKFGWEPCPACRGTGTT